MKLDYLNLNELDKNLSEKEKQEWNSIYASLRARSLTATIYAFMPMIIFTFIRVIVSHVLPLSAMGLVNGLQTAIWIFTFFLICIAMMTVHEYDFFKFALTGIVIVFFMILIVFVLLLIGVFLQQFWEFLYGIYEEAVYR